MILALELIGVKVFSVECVLHFYPDHILLHVVVEAVAEWHARTARHHTILLAQARFLVGDAEPDGMAADIVEQHQEGHQIVAVGADVGVLRVRRIQNMVTQLLQDVVLVGLRG